MTEKEQEWQVCTEDGFDMLKLTGLTKPDGIPVTETIVAAQCEQKHGRLLDGFWHLGICMRGP